MAIIRDDIDLPGPVPMPRRLEARWGRLDLHRGLQLVPPAPCSVGLRRLLRRHQRRLDSALVMPADEAPRLRVHVHDDFERVPAAGDDESYALRITSTTAEIDAPTPIGVSHALERLLQLIARDSVGAYLPAMVIEDAPVHGWRGLLLDLARHHLPLPVLLRTLDGMAALGLNVLHLHLNDDQGFRVEIASHPELCERSANGAFLRAAEVERLVTEAAWRGIRVIPELDVPGHAGALLHARPDLAVGVAPDALPRAFGPSKHALDPTLDETWAFLDDVVGDLAGLFDDECLHIGGDEVHGQAYAFEDPLRRSWCEARGLEDGAAVQRWFMARMVDLVRAHGRRAVVWDEALAPDLPRDVVVQAWRGANALEGALNLGHDAVFSAGYYLDLCYPARLHYAFDPAAGPDALATAEAELCAEPELAAVREGIAWLQGSAEVPLAQADTPRGALAGGEACLWSELVTPELLDVRLYGRLAAVAERLWSPPERTDVRSFYGRLPGLLAHLEAHTDCRPLSGGEPVLMRIGVRPDELHHVRVLLGALEPVRWYQRLLGARLDARLAAARGEGSGMGAADAARPYDADTPLQRPVDLLAPESLDVLRFDAELEVFRATPADPVAEVALRDRAHRWRMAQTALTGLRVRSRDFARLGGYIDALADLADILDLWMDGLRAGAQVGGGTTAALSVELARIEAALEDAEDREVVLAISGPLRRVLAPGLRP